eukprot:1184544-Prorocentrum_minimum.AAC.3
MSDWIRCVYVGWYQVGANMDYETMEEKTALFWAAEAGRLDSVAALIKKGVEIDYLNAQVYSHDEPIGRGKRGYNITLFYGSSCANDDKDALNTPDAGGAGIFSRRTDRTFPVKTVTTGV